ncbi:MAG: hypothetical protein SO435_06660 [Peptostreptococcus porci]|nr:hypothetical protein [Peptostreptococcus porci]
MGKSIYLITVLSNLDFFASFVLIVTALTFLIVTCIFFDFKDYCRDEECKGLNAYKSYIKKLAIIFSICITINILVPSKEEMYMIYATKYVTKENMRMTKDEVKNAIDYVFDKVKELNSEKK